MERGLIDADLGGGIVKKRIALPGRGKSGGSRVLLATNKGDRWFFIFGFEKNQQGNVSTMELAARQAFGADLLRLAPAELDNHVSSKTLQEICRALEDESVKLDP